MSINDSKINKTLCNTANANDISFLNLNIRSICEKSHSLSFELEKLENPPDILCITEPWFKSKNSIPLDKYKCACLFNRDNRRGGGSTIYVRPGILYSEDQKISDLSIEDHIEIAAICVGKVDDNNLIKPWHIISVYRPPKGNIEVFFEKLDYILDSLFKKNASYFLAGDFNIDILDTLNKNSVSFLRLLKGYNVNPLFLDKPSRIYKDSSTLIDNCLSNLSHHELVMWDPGLSDHIGQIVRLNIPKGTNSVKMPTTNVSRDWSEENCFNLLTRLQHFFSVPNHSNSKNPERFQKFASDLYNIMDSCVRLKNKRKMPKSSIRIKLSKDLLELSEERKHYYLLFKTTGIKAYKSASNKADKKLKKALYRLKRQRYDDMILNSKNRSKTVWNIVNKELNGSGKPLIGSLLHNDEVISDSRHVSNIFNDHFTNISDSFPTTPNKDKSLNLLAQSIKLPEMLGFSFHTITAESLLAVIKSLKANKADQDGDIPTFLFINYFDCIGPTLLQLINESIREGSFPTFLKTAKITPIFKNGDKKQVTNYRPISILPTLSKIFEKVLSNQLYSYFEANSLLSESQFGFRRKRCTIQAVEKLINHVHKAFNNRLPVVSLHFDLTKAFDLINHDLLLAKLKYYGLDDSAINLMTSYLSDRFQMVKIDSVDGPVFSDKCRLNAGVPQGSILGPLLFIIFINDLSFHINYPSYLFADDTSTVISDKNVCEESITAYLQTYSWFQVNGLLVNQTKTKAMFFLPSCQSAPTLPSKNCIDIGELGQVQLHNELKFLGIHMDHHLNWKSHVGSVINKLRSLSWAVRNLVKVTTKDCIMAFYHANIVSHLRYGVVLWGRSTDSSQLFIEQKKLLRLIFNLPYNYPCRELFKNHNLFTLPSLYIYELLKYAVENGIISPAMVDNQRSPHIKNELTRLKISDQNVSHSAIETFNKLPIQLRKCFMAGELNLFATSLQNFLIEKAFYSIDEM